MVAYSFAISQICMGSKSMLDMYMYSCQTHLHDIISPDTFPLCRTIELMCYLVTPTSLLDSKLLVIQNSL